MTKQWMNKCFYDLLTYWLAPQVIRLAASEGARASTLIGMPFFKYESGLILVAMSHAICRRLVMEIPRPV